MPLEHANASDDAYETIVTGLLESIAAEQLLILCGAGLSMARPSCLPSAASVARICRERYRSELGHELDPSLGVDLESIAQYFQNNSTFTNLFLAKLVPWEPFMNSTPNAGHQAVADFLACKVVVAIVTTNFDMLFEKAAGQLGEPDFRAIVSPPEIDTPTKHGRLLKVHGCADRSRPETVWCMEQLQQSPIKERMHAFTTWLAEKLSGKDLLIIGFWSEWAYLTELFAANLRSVRPRKVYLINPDCIEQLQQKAPALWAWVKSTTVQFHHVQVSGDVFLDDLRRIWSARFVTRLMNDACPTYQDLFGAPPNQPPDLAQTCDSHALYSLRRDLTGTPRVRPVRECTPSPSDHLAGAIHRRLLDRGACLEDHCYQFNHRSLRIISGRGRLLSQIRTDYQSEPTLPRDADQVVCAGAAEDASPSNIVRGDQGGSIVRSGSGAEWVTHKSLVDALRTRNEHAS